MSNPLRPSAGRRQRQHRTTPERRPRTLAAHLAAALLAAACSGAADTAAPATTTTASEAAAPAETTAAAPEQAAAPASTTAPTTPAATTTVPLAERCRQMGAEIADGLAAEARTIMGEGPGADLEQVAELRRRSTLGAFARTAGCTGGWTDGDEAAYQRLLAAAAAEAEQAGAEPGGENGEEAPDTTAEEPAGEEPEPAPATTVAAATVTTEDPGPAPDDPAWVDELPEPADPDPAPVGSEQVWDQADLRPLAEARPDLCEHLAHRCGPDGSWTRGPVAIRIGTRAVVPADPGYEDTSVVTANTGQQVRFTTGGTTYRYRVTGFAQEFAPGAGGLLQVRVLWHADSEWLTSWEILDTGETGEDVNRGDRDASILGVVLPEHADTITYDADGNMTGATLLLFHAPPLASPG